MFGFPRKKKDDAPTAAPRISAVAVSERGLVRRDNQDNLCVLERSCAFCVADGMGGGAEGARASEIVCAHLAAAVRASDGASIQSRRVAVDRALNAASAEIFTYSQGRGFAQMGSTFAGLFLNAAAGAAIVGHVGDSRVYRIRHGLSEQLTRDHTVGTEFGAQIDRRRIEEFRARENPLSHILTRAVGTQATVGVDWRQVEIMPGDRYVICSDGLHDVVSSTRLAALAGAGALEKVKERLSAEIVKRGAPDNYTFVVVEVTA